MYVCSVSGQYADNSFNTEVMGVGIHSEDLKKIAGKITVTEIQNHMGVELENGSLALGIRKLIQTWRKQNKHSQKLKMASIPCTVS